VQQASPGTPTTMTVSTEVASGVDGIRHCDEVLELAAEPADIASQSRAGEGIGPADRSA